MPKRLVIVVVESDPGRAQILAEGSSDAAGHDIRIIAEQSGLARQVFDLHRMWC